MKYEIRNYHGNNGEFARNADIWCNGKHVARVGVNQESKAQIFVLNGENGFELESDICRSVNQETIHGAIDNLLWNRDKNTDKHPSLSAGMNVRSA